MTTVTDTKTSRTVSRVHPFWGGLLLTIAILLCSAALASDDPGRTLRIGYVEFPPFQYQDENGNPAGSVVDLTRQVAAEAGYGVDFTPIPIGRVYLYLKNGQIDAWLGLIGVPDLKGAVIESDASPLTIELRAWFFEGTPPFSSLDDLDGKTLILIAGYTYGGLLEVLERDPQIRIYEAPDHQAALQMLAKGRGNYLLDYRQPVEAMLADAPMDGLDSVSIRERNTAWVFSLQRPNPVAAKAAFDSAYLRLARRNELPSFARHPYTLVPTGMATSGRGEEMASAN